MTIVAFGIIFLIVSLLIILRRIGINTVPKKKLLILDLNQLLVARVYAPKVSEEHAYALDYLSDADVLGKHFTWKRPGLDAFIAYCQDNFTVAVWSSAWTLNVDMLCGYVFGKTRQNLLFEWSQEQCTSVRPHPDPEVGDRKPLFEKNLSSVWNAYPQYNAQNTIILDDSDLKMRNNPSECVGICDRWGPWNTDRIETLDTVRTWLEDRK